MKEYYTIFNNKLAGKLMARGFVLFAMGKKYYTEDKYRNTYIFNKTENLMKAVAEITGNEYK